MSKYLYETVYEEFTGLKPPEPTDSKQRRKRGYGHPYRMRLNNAQETQETKPKKPERRNQFGQPITNRKNREEFAPRTVEKELTPRFNNSPNSNRPAREERRPYNGFKTGRILSGQGKDLDTSGPLLAMPQDRKGTAMPKVTYKKRRAISVDDQDGES
ncbi:hypothetical protein [Parendozoicomonas haliclonae]|uniref:Uncharacterized protein n=1 Tax=Parendozoicomonas haliclonae TaxID=1960125 RepID=A0A1X7AR33_9GAMM|nr:hypothetical protein [Parendozoicomonas haliclonae]SMA50592.1 hypothetical protein EHSB41UT_04409 [Parendozoicomonas haliclonae]